MAFLLTETLVIFTSYSFILGCGLLNFFSIVYLFSSLLKFVMSQ